MMMTMMMIIIILIVITMKVGLLEFPLFSEILFFNSSYVGRDMVIKVMPADRTRSNVL